jgi:uncharacterized protein YbcV (DUF1398 family)
VFTLDQINDIHERLGKQTTLPQYLQALKAIGVDKYDSFLTDGHSEYYGNDSQKVVSTGTRDIHDRKNKQPGRTAKAFKPA